MTFNYTLPLAYSDANPGFSTILYLWALFIYIWIPIAITWLLNIPPNYCSAYTVVFSLQFYSGRPHLTVIRC